MTISLKIKTAALRAARVAGALICAAAFGLSAGTAHAQTPFYRASAQELAGPPGTIIRSEPMLFALALGSSALTGCNTVRGAGTDIKKAGSEITEEAQEHKKY